jgi:hypothetical protein
MPQEMDSTQCNITRSERITLSQVFRERYFLLTAFLCEIWGSHSDDDQEYFYLLGYDAFLSAASCCFLAWLNPRH